MGLSAEANQRLSASASVAEKLDKVFAPAPSLEERVSKLEAELQKLINQLFGRK